MGVTGEGTESQREFTTNGFPPTGCWTRISNGFQAIAVASPAAQPLQKRAGGNDSKEDTMTGEAVRGIRGGRTGEATHTRLRVPAIVQGGIDSVDFDVARPVLVCVHGP